MTHETAMHDPLPLNWQQPPVDWASLSGLLEHLQPQIMRNPHAEPQVSDADRAKARPASVALIFVAKPEPHLIFTRRAQGLPFAGQWCFPGGKSAPEDRNPMSTALRETQEEIGLEAANLRYLASLGIYYTHSGFRMSPEVFFFDGVAGWQTSAEVSEVLLVPLSALADPERYRLVWRTSDRGNYRFEYERQLISGPTISICIQLLHRLSERSRGPI